MKFSGRAAALVLATAATLVLSACAEDGGAVDAGPGTSADAAASTAASTAPTVPPVSTAATSAETAPAEEPDADLFTVEHDDPSVHDAMDALATLEVKGRAPKTGYSRDEFGQRWKDIDRNGCDQRNDVLARDMTGVNRDGPCTVLDGTLEGPYTGTTIDFVRGQDTSNDVHIDHVVALSDAWQKGAQQLTLERREEFANDHRNLLAVDGVANMQKGDSDAATWLPANRGFRCTYVAIQVNVKAEYDLWVTAAERDAIARELGNCGASGIAPVVEEPAPVEEAVPAVPAAEQGPGGEVYYENCTAARAAGAAPIMRGEPGYRSQLDRDSDGVACE